MNTLGELVGRVITARDYNKAPDAPFRPYRKEPSTTMLLTNDVFDFSYKGYRGGLWLGWTHPWVKKNAETKKVIRSDGWRPFMAWGLQREIEGSRHTETHWEWDAMVTDDVGMRTKLNETLDPAYGLSNSKFKYIVTAGLAATFEDYLAAYFERPEVIRKVEEFSVLA